MFYLDKLSKYVFNTTPKQIDTKHFLSNRANIPFKLLIFCTQKVRKVSQLSNQIYRMWIKYAEYLQQ